MTKKISQLLPKTPKQPPLKPWPQKAQKQATARLSAQKPSMCTQFRLQLWFKPEFSNPRTTWWTNGLVELERYEIAHGKTLEHGEIQALYYKLRTYFGRIQRAVIYDKRPGRKSDIVFEWMLGLGITHNDTKNINWKLILEQ